MTADKPLYKVDLVPGGRLDPRVKSFVYNRRSLEVVATFIGDQSVEYAREHAARLNALSPGGTGEDADCALVARLTDEVFFLAKKGAYLMPAGIPTTRQLIERKVCEAIAYVVTRERQRSCAIVRTRHDLSVPLKETLRMLRGGDKRHGRK